MTNTYDLRVISLGAGVQSSAMYLMALEGDLSPMPDAAIFADTGWEPRAVYEHLDNLENIGGDRIPIHRVTGGNIRDDLLASLDKDVSGHIGQPPFFIDSIKDGGGMLWRKCTTDYKLIPIDRGVRELLGYKKGQRVKKRVQRWIGISIDEASRMKDSPVPWSDNYYPLIENMISRADCHKWLKHHGFGRPRKSACIGCPYHSAATWHAMKLQYPEEWADAVDFDAKLRTGKLPGVTGNAYLHRRMMPLPEAVNSTHDPDQFDLFENECEGMCGL